MSNKEIRNRILSGIFIVTAITRGFLPPLTADIVVSLVALVILLKVVRSGRVPSRNTLFLILWVYSYLLITLLGSFASIDFKAVVLSTAYYIMGLSIYFFLSWLIATRKELFDFMHMYVLLVGLISLLTVISGLLFWFKGKSSVFLYIRGSVARGAGLYGNPNYYAVSVLIAVGFLLGIMHFKAKGRVALIYKVGDGDQGYLKSVAQKYDVTEQVVFLGKLTHQDVFHWLDGIDVYIQPSKTEGLPRALIEAMSRGLPCLGSQAGGIPELLEEDCLFSITRRTVDEIADLLESLTRDSMERQARHNFEESRKYDEVVLNHRRRQFLREVFLFDVL